MSKPIELLVTSDSNNLHSCCLWVFETGASLMAYKGGGTAAAKTLNFIGEDYVAIIEKAKPIMQVWPINSQQVVQGLRFVLPGKASALAFTRDGQYCIAGIDEKIYLWQMSSGTLLTIISRHYQHITILKFTEDGRHFVSAAEDGMVMVWSLVQVSQHPEIELLTQSTAGQHDPLHIFSDHSLPVNDLYLSKFGLRGRLASASSDRSCKIYDLSTGEMLLNLFFNVSLLSVTMDPLELNLFVGTTEGAIHRCSLTNPVRSREQHVDDDKSNTYSGHTKGVTCLSITINGEHMASGSNDETVIIWHVFSRQQIRSISHKGPVTNAFFILCPEAMYKQDFCPTVILHNLKRTLEKNTTTFTNEIMTNRKNDFWDDIQTNKGTLYNSTSNSESNEDKLKQEIDKLKRINAELYSFTMKKVLMEANKKK